MVKIHNGVGKDLEYDKKLRDQFEVIIIDKSRDTSEQVLTTKKICYAQMFLGGCHEPQRGSTSRNSHSNIVSKGKWG